MTEADDLTTQRIRETIKRSGWHISAVAGGPVPLYAFTIGMAEHRGFEVLWAGGARFARNEMADVINTAGTMLLRDDTFELRRQAFRLVDVDPTWSALLVRGGAATLARRGASYKQVVPVADPTLDIADTARPFAPETAGAWRYLAQPWPFPVARGSVVTTDLAVLADGVVTEAERWDDDLFAAHGPAEWGDDDLRQVPLGALLSLDPSLEPLVRLEPGDRIHRAGAGAGWSEPSDLLDKPLR